MADFSVSLTKTLKNEGKIFHDHDTGEYSVQGISVWTLRSLNLLPKTVDLQAPASSSDIAFSNSLTPDQIADIYRHLYWNYLQADVINSQLVADKLFDLAVNDGPCTAIRLLQQGLNRLSWLAGELTEDGFMGPRTMASINGHTEAEVLDQLRFFAERRYRQIAANNPKLAKDLDGWLRRLASA